MIEVTILQTEVEHIEEMSVGIIEYDGLYIITVDAVTRCNVKMKLKEKIY